jgi:trans-aconitate methyltransferase
LTQYLFGDSDLAGHRLKVLAEVYADSTKSFVVDSIKKKPRVFFDLGCGPGHTTHLIANALGCEQAVGLDNSEHFISLAQTSATDRVSFHLHDVTTIPFPAGSADLLFCRFLMTHLRDPQAALSRWGTQLNAKGLLLIEEVETISTSNRIFAAYLEIVDAMLKNQN